MDIPPPFNSPVVHHALLPPVVSKRARYFIRHGGWCILATTSLAVALFQPVRAADGPEKPAAAEGSARLFSELPPEQTGLHFVQKIAVEDPQSYLYNSGLPSPSTSPTAVPPQA